MFGVEYKKICVGRFRVIELERLLSQTEYDFDIGQFYRNYAIATDWASLSGREYFLNLF